MNTIDSQGKTGDIPLSSQVYIRGLDIGGSGSAGDDDDDDDGGGGLWNFAIFGGGGVYIDNVSSVTGNVGSNGNISLRNNVTIDGDVVHLGDLDFQNENRIEFTEDHGDLVDYIIPPSATDFSGFGDALEPISEEDDDGEVTLIPDREYENPNFGNSAVLNLSSGVYYFESFTAGGTASNGLTLNIDLSTGSGHIEIFVDGPIDIGNNFIMNVTGQGHVHGVRGALGGSENVYFEGQYVESGPATPAINIGRNAVLRGTFYAPYDDIGKPTGTDLDGVDLEGSLYSGEGWVYVHNGSNLTYVPSTYLTDPDDFNS